MTVDERPVGAMQATVAADGSSADVAWEVGVPWQGQGLARARRPSSWLLDHGVPLIRALSYPEHSASARVAARAGLEPTTQLVEGEVMWHRMAG